MNKKIVFILFSFCNIFADEEVSQEGINNCEKTNEVDFIPNLGSKEDSLDYEYLNNSKVEENILINKNNWNTRKWGSIYFLFPHLTYWSIYHKFADLKIEKNVKKTSSFIGPIERRWLRILNFIFSGIVEYKWLFHKYCGINVRLNINNIEAYYSIEKNVDCVSFFSLDISFEWIYRRKNKHVWSGSISPIGFAFLQETHFEEIENRWRNMFTWSFVLLKYEYGNVFYMNLFKIKGSYFAIYNIYQSCINSFKKNHNNNGPMVTFVDNEQVILYEENDARVNKDWEKYDFGGCIFLNGFSMEFGLNIIGFYDWIKRKIKK